MSQQEQPQQQPTVRHIPIFVEGRSEPLVNKIPESQPSRDSSTSSVPDHHQAGPPPQQQQQQQQHHQQQQPRMPEMPSHTSDFFKHGSIFDRARDFPVRTFPSATANFFNKSSPARESSPARQVPIFTTDASAASAATTVPPQRGSSQPRQTPSPPTAAQQQQQYQQQQAQRFAQQQQKQAQDQPDAAAAAASAPPPPAANDPISKIQKIQRDVLAIFDQVERFQGGKDGKRDKQYLYLDEMLTQNLLKLDSIDAEDQPQIKSARREAIKSINHCIAVLEAKAEAGSEGGEGAVSGSASSDKVPNGTADRTGSGASLSHSSSNSSSQQQQQQQ